MKILGHCAYIGRTGYAIHSKNFFRALSKEADLKIRNFAISCLSLTFASVNN